MLFQHSLQHLAAGHLDDNILGSETHSLKEHDHGSQQLCFCLNPCHTCMTNACLQPLILAPTAGEAKGNGQDAFAITSAIALV